MDCRAWAYGRARSGSLRSRSTSICRISDLVRSNASAWKVRQASKTGQRRSSRPSRKLPRNSAAQVSKSEVVRERTFFVVMGDVQQIDIKLVGVEKHAASVGPEAGLITVFVEHPPKLREAPPERSSGIVRRVPEQLA